MLVCCLRLPISADGSSDVKQFAQQVAQSVDWGEPIYVIEEVCAACTPPFTPGMPLIPVGNIRPSLRFYLHNPLTCLEASHVRGGRYPSESYIISQHNAWSRVSLFGRVVLEDSGFILARSE
jgi:hypothetical protein